MVTMALLQVQPFSGLRGTTGHHRQGTETAGGFLPSQTFRAIIRAHLSLGEVTKDEMDQRHISKLSSFPSLEKEVRH